MEKLEREGGISEDDLVRGRRSSRSRPTGTWRRSTRSRATRSRSSWRSSGGRQARRRPVRGPGQVLRADPRASSGRPASAGSPRDPEREHVAVQPGETTPPTEPAAGRTRQGRPTMSRTRTGTTRPCSRRSKASASTRINRARSRSAERSWATRPRSPTRWWRGTSCRSATRSSRRRARAGSSEAAGRTRKPPRAAGPWSRTRWSARRLRSASARPSRSPRSTS